MKKILLFITLFYSGQLLANKWQPLQFDFNFIGIGLQSTYNLSPKWSISASAGIGIGVVSDFYSDYYDLHNIHSNGYSSDVFLFGTSFITPYLRLGGKYNITQTKQRQHIFYTRYQLTVYMPSTWVLGEDRVMVNYRNGLYLGLQNALDQKKKWNISFEVGAALWSNYDFCINKFGPLINLKITYDII